jgi:hypothetical protein
MKIGKFVIPVDDEVHTLSFVGSVLHVEAFMPNELTFWAAIEDRWDYNRKMFVIGTGMEAPESCYYCKTAVWDNGRLVWHLMELTDNE